MAFEKQVFISYAHLDNVPLTPTQDGWINVFHKTLSAALTMQLGREAQIWRDSKLAGNDIFADEIVQQFPKTELLISILTPRYVQSEWCTREVHEFYKSAQVTGGVRVENKSRIIKVIKTPVSDEKPLPDVMKDALGYPFFIYEDDKPVGLDPAFGPQFAEKLNLKIYLLAVDVAQLIGKIESEAPTGAAPAAAAGNDKPGIFIADCSVDLSEGREAVMSDLRGCGYPVYPETKLTTDVEASYLGDLAANLACCKLAVQILGGGYGIVPDGPSELSVPALTNALAVEYSRKFGLKRIIWVPSGTQVSSSRQQQFLDSLVRDPQAQFGADLITGNLEDLKSAIHAALKKIEAPPPPPPPVTEEAADGTKRVYLICDQRDKKLTVPLIKFLKAQGIQPNVPVFEGDAATVRQLNQDLLSACDAAIIFYGSGDEAWKGSIDAEILRSKEFRPSKKAPPTFTYLAEPSTDDKSFLVETEEPATLINCLSGFSESALANVMKTVTGKATQ
jgi:hypothetical protein